MVRFSLEFVNISNSLNDFHSVNISNSLNDFHSTTIRK